MKTTEAKSSGRRNPWPYAIIGWFILFISGMATWTVVAVRQDLDLVRSDYYDEEIRYQQQIDRVNRTSGVRGEVSILHDAQHRAIDIRLPAAHATRALAGRIEFYRPSDARLDFHRALALESGATQRIDVDTLRPGLWKIRVWWTVDGAGYFYDQTVIL